MSARTAPPGKVRPPGVESGGREDEQQRAAGNRSVATIAHPTVTTAPAMPCADCGLDTIVEYYMVYDHVWAAAGMDGGFLCIGCLEERLDRPLTGGDFPPHLPINWPDSGGRHATSRMRALKAAAAGLPWQGSLW